MIRTTTFTIPNGLRGEADHVLTETTDKQFVLIAVWRHHALAHRVSVSVWSWRDTAEAVLLRAKPWMASRPDITFWLGDMAVGDVTSLQRKVA